MRGPSALLLLAAGWVGTLPLAGGAAAQPQRWYRGNLHAHTNRASPDVVAGWYRDHGYQFVALTDIHRLTPVETLNGLLGSPDRFLVLPGVELSQEVDGGIVDVVGLGVATAVGPQDGETVADVVTADAAAVRAAGGVPIAAHPNLTWAVAAEDLIAADGFALLEIWNAEPGMHNLGGGGSPSTEQIWDRVLSTGRRLYGVAVDDSHHFDRFGPEWANPGRAWVMVRADRLDAETLLAALEDGDFYASTGVWLLDLESDEEGIRLRLDEENDQVEWLEPGRNPTRFRTVFVGRDGEVLKVDESLEPSYAFRGDELYVRARVEDSTGAVAWIQPVFPRRAED
ncbi:MAG: CehA/McbA family metallohydrolase [Thermoanaerobaculia bacterium]